MQVRWSALLILIGGCLPLPIASDGGDSGIPNSGAIADGVVLEVAGGSSAAYSATYVIPDGFSAPTYYLGDVQRIAFEGIISISDRGGQLRPYPGPVVMIAAGLSNDIPNRQRVYIQQFKGNDAGTYVMPVGEGTYTLRAQIGDPSVAYPPVKIGLIAASGNSPVRVDFTVAGADTALTIEGRIFKTAKTPFSDLTSSLYVEVIDIDSGEPYSQKTSFTGLAPGMSDGGGAFSLVVDPAARLAQRGAALHIIGYPGGPFSEAVISLAQMPPAITTLDAGDIIIGDPGPSLQVVGTIVDSRKQKIAGANVSIQGTILDGKALYRSVVATTDSDGGFTVSAPRGALNLWVYPPPAASAALKSLPITVGHQGTTSPSSTFDLGTVTVDAERTSVMGYVLTPGGYPAGDIKVVATALSTVSSYAGGLQLQPVETKTDANGKFTVRLDAAGWSIAANADPPYIPTFTTYVLANSTGASLSLPAPLTLPRGRLLSGNVSLPSGDAGMGTGSATVAAFRVVTTVGYGSGMSTMTSLLLSSDSVGSDGTYSILVPLK